MQLEIHWEGMRLSEPVRAYVERRLRFALGRVEGWVSRVLVKLKDLNGPHGGVDKCCQLVVSFPRSNPLIVEHRDADWLRAVDLAADRLAHAVRRELKRRVRNRRAGAADKPSRQGHTEGALLPLGGGTGHAL